MIYYIIVEPNVQPYCKFPIRSVTEYITVGIHDNKQYYWHY